jgi:hypothetical protein
MIFNIITTNKNKIAIAPTYTIKNIKAIKSTSIKINNIEVFINAIINQNTEYTGFKEDNTITAEIIIPIPKK